ncbi:MAG: glycosyltransferase 87 family protein [Promethearchaeota archaeon]
MFVEKIRNKPINFYYIIVIAIISIILIIERIIFYFINIDEFPDDSLIVIVILGRDADFHLIKGMMENGIVNFYDSDMPYLYFSYFIFFPIYILPSYIGVYINDALRLITVIYIAKTMYKLTEDKNDQFLFYLLSIIGYLADATLNNNNWLILLLLFESMVQLKKEKKILAGIIFSFAAYKILVMIFLFVLLLGKKIKIKELVYYFLPIIVLCIPYLIFPEYTFKMIQNWSGTGGTDLVMRFFHITWQLSQTAQLLFMSFIGFALIIDLEHRKKIGQYKKQVRIMIFILLFFIYVIFEAINVIVGYFLQYHIP